jgi:hypothetical protein
MLFTATDNTRIDFTLPSDTALRRIIVDPDVKSVGVWLGNKCIEQLATYIKGARVEQAFSTPNNLTNTLQCSPNVESSSIWSDFNFSQVGDAGNWAQVGVASGFPKIEKLDPLPISHYMTETESHMIEQWAGHVVESLDPNTIIPDSPIEGDGQKKPGRSRRIKIVDDDEEEEDDDEQSLPVPLPVNTSNSMNDALNSQFNAQKVKFGRTRVLRIDEEEEDEDDEDFGDKVSSGGAEERNTRTYPPLADSNAYPSRSMPSMRKHGRQRMVKVDSDDGEEENGWPSPDREPKKQPSDWDDTIYPAISSFGTSNDFTGKQLKTAKCHDTVPLPKNPVSHRSSGLKPGLSTDELGTRGEDQGRGETSTRKVLGLHQAASTPHPASSRGRGWGSGRHDPHTPSQQSRGRPNTRGSRASRGGPPSGRGRGRGTSAGRGGNKFGALADDPLVDISESEVVDPQLIPPPPGFECNSHMERQNVPDVPTQAHVNDASLDADLIDVSTPEVLGNRHVAPPPGFESLRVAGKFAEATTQRNCSPVASRHGSSPASKSSRSVPSALNTGAFYVNTSKPGMNLIEMSRRRVEELHKAGGEAAPLDTSTENLQEVDESSTRIYHRTMNQQAKKPTPKKKDVEQKRAEALQAAWGAAAPPSQAKPSSLTAASSARNIEASDMSAAKKRLLRGKETMASSHPEAANREQTELQNDQFVAALMPVFKAARAFPGVLKFELQLGQFLSPSPEGAYQPKCVTVNQWHRLYDSAQGRLASARTFTNILTRNGADIDHILKLKIPSGGGSKIFHHDNPGRYGLRLEFHCQGKNNDDFKLVLDSKGRYEIERPFREIAQVNLHVPGQIWDAAGMLTGSTQFAEEQALKDAAEELAKSVFIPEGRKEIEISYRLPSSNEFAVKRIVMRRISRHMCSMLDKHDVQLQITEVQRLFVERRAGGRYLAYASKYEKMVQQMMIHFEVSLLSESIERAMSANANLAIGDITSAWTEDSLLQKWRTRALLEVSHMVVSKIDGVGFHNIGSAVFFLGQNSVLGGGSAVAIGSAVQNQSMTKLATQNVQAVINVPGVRGGVAQPASQGYALGYGGARIPIPGLGEADAAVVPDDSASQAPPRGETQGGQVMPGFW